MLLLSTIALGLCAICVEAVPAGSSSGGGSSSSKASSTAAPATTTKPPPAYEALTATTLSAVSAPSGLANHYSAAADFSGLYSSYWSGADGVQTAVEPQPVIYDPLSELQYAEYLTDPNTVPQSDYVDSAYIPPSWNASLNDPSSYITGPEYNISLLSTPTSRAIATAAAQQIVKLINGSATDATSQCNTCYAALKVAQQAIRQVPFEGPGLATQLCNLYSFSKSPTCDVLFTANVEGAVATQILYYADLDSTDATWICNSQFKVCSKPGVTDYYPKVTDLISNPNPPSSAAPTPKAGGQRLKVLHLSDIHIDPRYDIGSEGNCTSAGLCCRQRATNSALYTTSKNASVPAPRYGYFLCDAPFELVVNSFEAITSLTGIKTSGPAFSIFTGDIVSHDLISEISSDYASESETIVYELFKQFLTGANHSAPVYPTISNHDNRYGAGWNAPKHLQPGYIQDLYQENYNHLAGLWQYEGWLSSLEAKQSRNHYTAYSAKTPFGLRIFSLNANVFYPSNIYNLLNTSNADQFGLFKFMADELQAAEDAGERVWIIMHQNAGWDGTNGLPNPTDLYYQIVNRYSPHTIAAIFAGHTHEDQLFLNYANNATNVSAATAKVATWTGPSITPLTGLNAGFRMYEVDAETFDIMDSHTWFANVTSFGSLDGQTANGPGWSYEYSARQAYGQNITWPSSAPLNATWWHLVTEQMQRQPSLIETYQIYQSKSSTRTTNCTSTACQQAKVCYIRSGSHALAQKCPTGYGSTQG